MFTKGSTLFKFILMAAVVLLLLPGLLACGGKSGNAASGKKIAFTPLTVLSFITDNVQVSKADGKNWTKGKVGDKLETGDKIKTDGSGRAAITFFDGSVLDLSGDTEISLENLTSKSASAPKSIKIKQTLGRTTSRIVKLVDSASRYEIETPAGVAAVRGSTMDVVVAKNGETTVYNVEGAISLIAQGKEVAIPKGSGSTATPGEAPSAPKPGLLPDAGASNITWVSSKMGWQQTTLQVNSGDKFYVEYRGGSWSIDFRNFVYVGAAGYSPEIDKTIAVGYKIDSSKPYGFLLAKVGDGAVIQVGNQAGPFQANASGFLSLRINDVDASLGDNDGAITVVVGKK